jgi:hypothetical protein
MLYCITANYTPKAMEAMAKNPNATRKEAVEKAGGGRWRQIGRHVWHHTRRSWRDGDHRCRSRYGSNNSGRRSLIRRHS